ncbi:DUF3043 domain-containing protein [Bifidobacterium pullorum subsp. saeculare]|uniref:DUF3043 domain-containing protein n=1 Tax=Bifidobacterium pullorum subsp. saeculare TaxID=78257 RepID=A0A938WWH4_9BIFI|nr:DUF3043 domain-containing protein [Bifidobacterium pullorum]MBM6699131.1 DUF3043 domain-containing protein [Bifidobacterium pullorum subsp. saeculare]
MTWNPFKKKDEAQRPVAADAPAPKADPNAGKGRPTPKMKAAQAQNLRPLVPLDRKASAKAARKRLREKENLQYEAMQKGDLRHMPRAEQLPWRIYIRDYVDARFNLGEYFIPVAFIILIGSMLITTVVANPYVSMGLMLLMYAYLIAVIIDIVVMWRKLKKKLVAKFGEVSVAKGSRSASYAWSRAIQMRRWRLPKPREKKRGHFPE